MRMEDAEKNNSLSAEKQEQKNDFARLVGIMFALPDAFGNNSNKAYEVQESINEFYDKLQKDSGIDPKSGDIVLKKYLLGQLLLNTRETLYNPDIPYDTDSGEIGIFIKKLGKEYNINPEEETTV